MKIVVLNKKKKDMKTQTVNEASILKFIDSDYLVRFYELIEHRDRLWMFLDFMDCFSQEKII